MSSIYDTILWLQSQATAKRFPIVQFSGDTDMVTDEWVSLTSIDRPEIVVTQVTAEEYRAIANSPDGYLEVERRVNTALKRSDLKCSWLARVEEAAPSAKGLSFQEFREAYQPPKLYFRDILYRNSLATEVSRTTRSEFEHNGGKVVVLQ